MREANLIIDGMHCDACVRRVVRALEATPGVEPESVSVGSARVRLDGSESSVQAAIDSIGNAGYTAKIQDPL